MTHFPNPRNHGYTPEEIADAEGGIAASPPRTQPDQALELVKTLETLLQNILDTETVYPYGISGDVTGELRVALDKTVEIREILEQEK